MIRRQHAVLTGLAAAGALLTLFQCWYIHLPIVDAAAFDVCRVSKIVNCFRSLYAYGADLRALGLPVFSTLFSLFLFQLSLSAFAFFVEAPRRDAWLALARLASFPASGFAIYVLLNDALVSKATSVSAILVAIASLSISVMTVLQGFRVTGLRNCGKAAFGLALACVLAGFLLQGAGAARRETDEEERRRLGAPPSVRYARFAETVPRRYAAALGDPTAPKELLLFVDPSKEDSRALMREALEVMPEFGSRVLLTIYAPGEHGVMLVLAQKRDSVAPYLRDLKAPPGEPESVRHLAERMEEAWRALGIREFPTAVWEGGQETGSFTLRGILERIAPPEPERPRRPG